MRRSSVTDFTPRIELLPLIDVVFLLLTFFIYAMAVMVRADLLPVELTPLQHGQSSEAIPALSVTMDQNGDLFLDREPASLADLPDLIHQRLAEDPELSVFLALEDNPDTTTDRGPLLITVVETLREAGVEDLTIVGTPGQ